MALKAWGTGTHAMTSGLRASDLFAGNAASNTRVRHKATSAAAHIVAVFDGYETLSAVNPDAWTVKAGLDNGSRFLFASSATGTVPSGALLQSDPLAVSLDRGDLFYTRTRPAEASGHWGLNRVTYPARDEGAEYPDSGVDKSAGGTIDTNNVFAACPAALLAEWAGTEPYYPVLLLGDSIMDGQAGTSFGSYAVRALEAAGVPHIWASQGSTQQEHTPSAHVLALAPFCDFVIDAWAINDLRAGRSAAAIWADKQALQTALALPTFLTTITPSQEVGWTGGMETQRLALNALIRAETGSGQFAGHFEVADLAETARNSGTWRGGYTDDSLHPNETGHTALTAAVSAAPFATGYTPPTPPPSGPGSDALLAARRACVAA